MEDPGMLDKPTALNVLLLTCDCSSGNPSRHTPTNPVATIDSTGNDREVLHPISVFYSSDLPDWELRRQPMAHLVYLPMVQNHVTTDRDQHRRGGLR